jgi:hypothetical protein
LLIGGPGATKSKSAWDQTYRALDHGALKNLVTKKRNILRRFPAEVQEFADAFVALQSKRHAADYSPNEKFLKSSVVTDIEYAEYVIQKMESVPKKDKRAFAALVLLRLR